MNTSPIASDLSYLVLQKRRREAQRGLEVPDSSNQTLYPITPCLFDAYIADRTAGIDRATWDAQRINRRLER
jgi:hypothetical protein